MKMLGHSLILGIGAYLPDKIVHSDELMERANSKKFGLPIEFMSRKIGIVERRWATSESYVDLAYKASVQAINNASLSPTDIDLIIYCGISGQYKEPSTAHEIQARIGAKKAMCFDASNACLGIVTSMMTANAFIKSGAAENVLLCTAEKGSDIAQMTLQKMEQLCDKPEFRSYLGGLTIGDAGGALVLTKNERSDHGVIYMSSASEGEHAKLCYYNDSVLEGFNGQMNMAEITERTIALHRQIVEATYSSLGWAADDLTGVYAHQVGRQPHKETCKIIGQSIEKCFVTYDLYGNLASATIPVNMYLNPPKPGHKYLLFASGSGISVCHVGLVF